MSATTKTKTEETIEIGKNLAKQVPDPVGYKILIMMPKAEEKTDGGVFIPDSHRDREAHAFMVGYVLKLGADAYKDAEGFKPKFISGPWCKEGDFVMFRSYTGSRFTMYGHELRLINDESVEAVVEDPRTVMRAS